MEGGIWECVHVELYYGAKASERKLIFVVVYSDVKNAIFFKSKYGGQ